MLAIARFLAMGFLFLTLIYLCLWLYARAARREALEAEWHLHGAGEKGAFVAEGLASQAPGLRRRLIMICYGAPVVLFVFVVFATNFM